MKQILLIDLDDTLLTDSSTVFFPAYLDALSKYLNFLAEPETVLTSMFQATERMRNNLNPTKSLKQIFDEAFYPQFNTSYSEQKDRIDHFYTTIHPTLHPAPCPQLEVIEFVEQSLEKGFELVIATDPYFPLRAVHDRLRWAGLPPEKYPFSLITSYEASHFTKPHPAYYAEVLAKLGWPEASITMIGNDIERDILPAKEFGLATYHTTPHGHPSPTNGNQKHGSGALSEFHAWYQELPEDTFLPDFSEKQSNLEIMRATPAVLKQRISLLSDEAWNQSLNDGEWNPTEIICHFRDVDRDIHIPRFEQVRDNPNPFLEAVDADSWAQERRYSLQDGKAAFADFLETRLLLLEILQTLPASVQAKNIQHTIFGPTTLDELVKIAARHDRLHIQQLFSQISPYPSPT